VFSDQGSGSLPSRTPTNRFVGAADGREVLRLRADRYANRTSLRMTGII
jgi:hypothetical protein